MRRKQSQQPVTAPPGPSNAEVGNMEPEVILAEMGSDVCRLCAQIGPSFFEIFGDVGAKRNISVLAKNYLSIELSETDNLRKICVNCFNQLVNFHQFVLHVQSIQSKHFDKRVQSSRHDQRIAQNFDFESKIEDAEFFISKCESSGFDGSQEQFLRDPAPVGILPELPLDLESDFDGPDTLKLDNAELCSASSAGSEEDEAPVLRSSRTGARQQEKELAEFYELTCAECNSKWPNFSTLAVHCRQSHGLMRPSVTCHCGKSFNRRSHLVRHRNHHLGAHRYKCETCDKGFHFKFMLRSHMFTHGPESDKPYKCELCSRTYITRSGLTNHNLMKHAPPKARVSCDICNSTFSHPNCLYTHKKTVHADQRSFVCHICGKTMSTMGNLKGHLETHKEASNVQCEVCGKRFKTRMRLVRHKEYHKAIVHECPVCGKQYQTRGALRSHLLVHSEDRPHKCTICQKSFKRSKQLKLHLYQHTGERPYKCPHCPKTFTNAGNRATHKRRIHLKTISTTDQVSASAESVSLFHGHHQSGEVLEPLGQSLHQVQMHPQAMLVDGGLIHQQHLPHDFDNVLRREDCMPSHSSLM